MGFQPEVFIREQLPPCPSRASGRRWGRECVNTSRVTRTTSTCHLEPSTAQSHLPADYYIFTLGKRLEKPALVLEGGWGSGTCIKGIKIVLSPDYT